MTHWRWNRKIVRCIFWDRNDMSDSLPVCLRVWIFEFDWIYLSWLCNLFVGENKVIYNWFDFYSMNSFRAIVEFGISTSSSYRYFRCFVLGRELFILTTINMSNDLLWLIFNLFDWEAVTPDFVFQDSILKSQKILDQCRLCRFRIFDHDFHFRFDFFIYFAH